MKCWFVRVTEATRTRQETVMRNKRIREGFPPQCCKCPNFCQIKKIFEQTACLNGSDLGDMDIQ